MTDPIYGDSPVDPTARWYQTSRPPLVNDPEYQAWQAVITAAMGEFLESSWLVRWRTKSVVTAEGVHLDALGKDLGFIRPDGWDNDRYRNVLIPIDGVAWVVRTPFYTKQMADGLVDGAQTWKIQQTDPCEYVVFFFGLTENEAKTYFSVLKRAKPAAVRMVLVFSPEAEPDVFTLNDSALDGPDVLAFTLATS